MPPVDQFADTRVESGPPAEPPAARPALKSIGGYEIIEELGRGGMGVVYKAYDAELKRHVALKVLSAGADASVDALIRFRGEAEVVARLQHPHIVQIYDSGQHEGQQFLVLELVEGGSLDKQIAGQPQQPRDAALIVETLARAVAVAHGEGIIHRDLKPANVLRSKNGTLKITDFGLAKQLDQSTGMSRSGDLRGTPQYMAPEQAGRRNCVVGPATDVYALGAILYELLTGRPPFVATNLLDVLDQILDTEAASPSRLVPKLPRDLCTICLKCLEKDPSRRYVSATELAADLRRWLDGAPIVARPLGRVERGLRFIRRHPWPVAFAVILGLTVFGFVTYIIREQARNAARLEIQYDVAQSALDEISATILRDPRLARNNPLVKSLAKHYEILLTSQEELQDADPVRLAVAHQVRGKLLTQSANATEAVAAYETSLGFLAKAPDGPDRPVILAQLHLDLGMLHRELRQFDNALAQYELADRALAAAADRDQPRCQRIRAEISHQRGIVLDPTAGKQAALKAYEIGRDIRLKLPRDAETMRDLARSHGYIGDVLLGLNQDENAEKAYVESHKWRQESAADVNDRDAKFQLARSYGNFGILHARNRQVAKALESFQEAAKLQRELLADDPTFPDYVNDYAGTLCRLAELKRLTRPAEAADLANQAEDKVRPFYTKEPESAAFRSNLADALLQAALARVDAHQPAAARPMLEEARMLLRGHERNEVDLYNHAAVLALLAEQGDSTLRNRALTLLAEALAKGYYRKCREALKSSERPWSALRGDPEFQRVVGV